LVIVAVVATMIFFTALYVAAEFAAVAARKTRISQMAASGNSLARMLLPFLEDRQKLDSYIAVSQLGITATSLGLGAYGQGTVAEQLVPPLARLIGALGPRLGAEMTQTAAVAAAESISATGILLLFTVLQVVLGELFPKSLAVQYPEQVALATTLPMRWSLFIFRPFIWFFNGSGNLILRLTGFNRPPGHTHVHSPEEIEILVTESHQGGLLDDEERVLLRNAFRLRDLTARQVMVHRTRIVAAPAHSTVAALMNMSLEGGFTRIPLYQGNIDHIIGFVHIKDIFRLHVLGKENLAEILREVVHVPESMAVADVWDTLSRHGQYMAIVFDEYGGTAGLITFEDLIEEIFGELQDEFDNEIPLIAQDKEGRMYLRGDLLVTDVNEYLGLSLPDEDADTLGGLVLVHLGRLPEVGDEVTLGGTVIRVEAVGDLGVNEVSLQPLSDNSQNGATHIGEWEVAEHE
jgi:CBS domain containing-hemolysin-like protein